VLLGHSGAIIGAMILGAIVAKVASGAKGGPSRTSGPP
jgi:hypothetical protein